MILVKRSSDTIILDYGLQRRSRTKLSTLLLYIPNIPMCIINWYLYLFWTMNLRALKFIN